MSETPFETSLSPDLASDELTTHMKSVGEVLAIGRTFAEAFGKAM